MSYQLYPSDLTDREWEYIKALLPAAKPGGRKRETDLRLTLNAIFYVTRTGCPWRYAPRDFRPDTKMPHFYNHDTSGKADELPDDQKAFPATEASAIAHYLFVESKRSLKGADSYRDALLAGKSNLHELQDELEGILRGAVIGLRDGTISSDGLDTFKLGYEFVRDEIGLRREHIKRHTAPDAVARDAATRDDNVVVVKAAQSA